MYATTLPEQLHVAILRDHDCVNRPRGLSLTSTAALHSRAGSLCSRGHALRPLEVAGMNDACARPRTGLRKALDSHQTPMMRLCLPRRATGG